MDLLYCLREHTLPTLTPCTVCILIYFFIFSIIKSTVGLLAVACFCSSRLSDNISESGSLLANHNMKEGVLSSAHVREDTLTELRHHSGEGAL